MHFCASCRYDGEQLRAALQCHEQQGADDIDSAVGHLGHSWQINLYSNGSWLMFYPKSEYCVVSFIALKFGSSAFPPNWTDPFSFQDRRYVNGIKASVYDHSYILSGEGRDPDVEVYAQYAVNKGVPVHWDLGFFDDQLYSNKAMPIHWRSANTHDTEEDDQELSRGDLISLYSADVVTFKAGQLAPEQSFAWPSYCSEVGYNEPAPSPLQWLHQLLSQPMNRGMHAQSS